MESLEHRQMLAADISVLAADLPQSHSIVSHWGVENSTGAYVDTVNTNHLTNTGAEVTTGPHNNSALDLEADEQDYLSIPDATQTGLDNNGNMTFSQWINFESTTTNQTLFSKDVMGGNQAYFLQYKASANALEWVSSSNGSNFHEGTIPWQPEANTWYQLTASFNATNGTLTIFANNEALGTITNLNPTIHDSTADFMVGRRQTFNYFDGKLGPMTRWNTALTAEEVADMHALYTTGEAVPSTAISAALVDGMKRTTTDFTLSADNWENPNGGLNIQEEGTKLPPNFSNLYSKNAYQITDTSAQHTTSTFTFLGNESAYITKMHLGDLRIVVEVNTTHDTVELFTEQGSQKTILKQTGVTLNSNTSYQLSITHTQDSITVALQNDNGVPMMQHTEDFTAPISEAFLEAYALGQSGVVLDSLNSTDASSTIEAANFAQTIPEQLSVINTAGRTILTQFSSPYDRTLIRFQDTTGRFSEQTLEHPGGTTSEFATITMPPNQVATTIEMVHPDTSFVISTVNLQWDSQNNQLTIPEGSPDFQPVTFTRSLSGAVLSAQASLDQLLEDVTVQDDMNTYFTQVQEAIQGPNMDMDIEQITATHLFQSSVFYIQNSYEQFYQNFPQYALARIMADANNTSDPAGYQDTMLSQRSDYLDALDQTLASYAQNVVDLFAAQMNLLLYELGKTNVNPAYHQNAINIIFNERWYAPHMQELRTLIPVPDITPENLQQEVETVFMANINTVLKGQASQTRRDTREWNAATKEAREAEAIALYASDWNDYWTTQIHSDAADTFFRNFTTAEWERAELTMTPSQWNEVAAYYHSRSNETGGSAEFMLSEEDANRIATALANLESSTTSDQRFDSTQTWYLAYQNTLEQEFTVRTDTAVGRLFWGLANGLWANRNDRVALADMVAVTEKVTNIPAWKVFQVIDSNIADDAERRFIGGLKELFETAQYSHIFEEQNSSDTEQVISAATDMQKYSIGQPIQVRFDAVLNGNEFNYAQILLPDGTSVSPSAYGELFFEVDTTSWNFTSDNMQLTIRVRYTDGTEVEKLTNIFDVVESQNSAVITNDNLSTLDANDANYQLENEILKRVQFPLNETENGVHWYNALGSIWHTGKSIHAADLNLKTYGDTDLNMPVFASADGVIVEMFQEKSGKVLIQHSVTYEVNGEQITKTWFTQYLHMNLSEEQIAAWEAAGRKLEISAGEQIGTIGKWGGNNPNGFPAHLDFQVRGEDSMSINMSNWLVGKVVSQEGEDVDKNDVYLEWSETYKQWVKKDDESMYWDYDLRKLVSRN